MAAAKVRQFKMWLRQQKVNAFCALVRLFSGKRPEIVKPPLPSNLSKILFLRTDGKVGDFIVASFALAAMAKFYQHKVDVVTSGALLDLAALQPYVGKVIAQQQSWGKLKVKSKIFNAILLGLKLRKVRYDLIIDVEDDGLKLETAIAIFLAKAKFSLAFNPPPKDKIINVPLKFDFKALKHFIHAYNEVLKVLGISPLAQHQVQYQIALPSAVEAAGEDLVRSLRQGRQQVLAFNVFAGGRSRNFTLEQIKAIIRALPQVHWVLLGPWQKLQDLQVKLGNPTNVTYPFAFLKTWQILGSLSLIKACDVLVSVDTFAIHAAVGFKKPFWGIFSEFKSHTWGPLERNSANGLFVYDDALSVPELDLGGLTTSIQCWIGEDDGAK